MPGLRLRAYGAAPVRPAPQLWSVRREMPVPPKCPKRRRWSPIRALLRIPTSATAVFCSRRLAPAKSSMVSSALPAGVNCGPRKRADRCGQSAISAAAARLCRRFDRIMLNVRVGSSSSVWMRTRNVRSSSDRDRIAASRQPTKRAMYGRRPRCKRNLTYLRSVRVQPCIRPVFEWRTDLHCDAAAMAAGPDVIR